jgi:hypothetical protein
VKLSTTVIAGIVAALAVIAWWILRKRRLELYCSDQGATAQVDAAGQVITEGSWLWPTPTCSLGMTATRPEASGFGGLRVGAGTETRDSGRGTKAPEGSNAVQKVVDWFGDLFGATRD